MGMNCEEDVDAAIEHGWLAGYAAAFREHVLSRYPAGDYYRDEDAERYARDAWEKEQRRRE